MLTLARLKHKREGKKQQPNVQNNEKKRKKNYEYKKKDSS